MFVVCLLFLASSCQMVKTIMALSWVGQVKAPYLGIACVAATRMLSGWHLRCSTAQLSSAKACVIFHQVVDLPRKF